MHPRTELTPSVDCELARIMAVRTRDAMMVSGVLVGLVVVGILRAAPLFPLVGWAIYMLGLTVVRVTRIRSFLACPDPTSVWQAYIRWETIAAGLSGLGWGVAAPLLIAAVNFNGQVFIAFMLAGLSAGAVTTYSAVRKTGLCFLLTALVPLITYFVSLGESHHYQMAAALGLYLVFMVRQLRSSHLQGRDLLRVNQENTRLLTKVIAEKDRAEAAARAKTEFLATISHEIRTPLNGILGMTDLLAKTELKVNQARFTRHIKDAGDTLLATLNSVLDFSRFEAGEIELNSENFEPFGLLETIASSFIEEAERKGIDLILDLPFSDPGSLRGDTVRIRQIIFNLLSNAVKFTGNGHIALRASGELQGSAYWFQCDIEDTGCGIPVAQLERVFEPFVQLDDGMNRRQGGTGLGLSISRKLATAMGGTLKVHSDLGQGTTFRLTLSLPLHAASPVPAPMRSTRRLLMWQIPTLVGAPLARYAAHHGHTALTPCNEAMLFALLRESQATTVLLDSRLDTAGAVKFANSLKSSFPQVRIIALEAYTRLDETARIRPTSIDDALTLPIARAALGEALLPRLRNTQIDTTAEPLPLAAGTILVAEDNPVNQAVLGGMLEALGIAFEIASDGHQVVTCWEAEHTRYSLILMDCQMPGLDGYAATAEIRRRELERGVARTPIVAVTAHYGPSDRARCLAAGMDDYLSKPFTRAALNNLLLRWMPVDDSRVLLDPAALATLRSLQAPGKPLLIQQVFDLYRQSAPLAISTMFEAFHTADADAVRRTAHGLKSSSANVGASQLSALCKSIEQHARGGDLASIEALLPRLEPSLAATLRALQDALAEAA